MRMVLTGIVCFVLGMLIAGTSFATPQPPSSVPRPPQQYFRFAGVVRAYDRTDKMLTLDVGVNSPQLMRFQSLRDTQVLRMNFQFQSGIAASIAPGLVDERALEPGQYVIVTVRDRGYESLEARQVIIITP